uniref:Uncharacterized protein n=1 Tax=Rhizophora mucronata TaxID=61149 RepID=A0A2P2Q1W5_RHIMU
MLSLIASRTSCLILRKSISRKRI